MKQEDFVNGVRVRVNSKAQYDRQIGLTGTARWPNPGESYHSNQLREVENGTRKASDIVALVKMDDGDILELYIYKLDVIEGPSVQLELFG